MRAFQSHDVPSGDTPTVSTGGRKNFVCRCLLGESSNGLVQPPSSSSSTSRRRGAGMADPCGNGGAS
jgi:hypothetical protein